MALVKRQFNRCHSKNDISSFGANKTNILLLICFSLRSPIFDLYTLLHEMRKYVCGVSHVQQPIMGGNGETFCWIWSTHIGENRVEEVRGNMFAYYENKFNVYAIFARTYFSNEQISKTISLFGGIENWNIF